MTGVDMVHVPYKGSAPAVTDLLGGQVQVMFDSSVVPHVKSGKLKALAVTSTKRSTALPEVPTALRGETFWRHLPFSRSPEVTLITPDQVKALTDETHLLVDQQDVTPMGLAYQAIELGTSTSVLDGALRRVIRTMRI